eukprot:jgi/Mesen1/11055/ME000099S10498
MSVQFKLSSWALDAKETAIVAVFLSCMLLLLQQLGGRTAHHREGCPCVVCEGRRRMQRRFDKYGVSLTKKELEALKRAEKTRAGGGAGAGAGAGGVGGSRGGGAGPRDGEPGGGADVSGEDEDDAPAAAAAAAGGGGEGGGDTLHVGRPPRGKRGRKKKEQQQLGLMGRQGLGRRPEAEEDDEEAEEGTGGGAGAGAGVGSGLGAGCQALAAGRTRQVSQHGTRAPLGRGQAAGAVRETAKLQPSYLSPALVSLGAALFASSPGARLWAARAQNPARGWPHAHQRLEGGKPGLAVPTSARAAELKQAVLLLLDASTPRHL